MELVANEETLDEKLSRPVFWGKLAGLTFQELQPGNFEESLELIKNYLIPEEVLCVGLNMEEDPEGCENLLENARNCMRDGTSIVVLDEDGDERDSDKGGHEDGDEEGHPHVVGVMVARVVQQMEHMRSFSRIKVTQGDSYQKWLALRCHLQKKADLFDEFGVDKYYRIYHIVVHPDYRRRGVASFLVRLAAERLTRLFAGRSLCTAVAPSRVTQRLLSRQGFRRHVVLPYHEWHDDSGRQVIDNVGVGNYSVVLFVYQVGGAGAEEGEEEPIDVSPLANPAEESEPEPEPPTEFPGRELGRKPPPPSDCRQLPGLRPSVKRSQSTYPPYPMTDIMDLTSSTTTERYSMESSSETESPTLSGLSTSPSPHNRGSH